MVLPVVTVFTDNGYHQSSTFQTIHGQGPHYFTNYTPFHAAFYAGVPDILPEHKESPEDDEEKV